jgi:hypothetical protein
MSKQPPATTARIDRFEALYARLEEVCGDPNCTDGDLNPVCEEICCLSDEVLAAPVRSWSDIVERALAAHYWFRDKGSDSPDVVAAQGLIAAVLGYHHETAAKPR